jgi:multimeric flavodoxin WrbA
MRVAILDGDTEAGPLSEYVGELARLLTSRGHDVKLFALRDLDIGYCTGCWSCWWATPGECAYRDDSAAVCAAVVNSDLTIFASPIVMGFVSAVLKKTQDKLVPLIHPYVTLIRGGSRHRKRYRRLPTLGLLLERGDADDEDVRNTVEMEAALARDFRARMAFARLTTRPVGEIADEIDGLQRVAAR